MYLKQDAKRTYSDIAELLDLSPSTVRKRVNNLVESGVIKRFTIEINPEFAKQNITAFITLIPEEGSMRKIIELVRHQTFCSQVFCLNGKCGLLVITATESAEELDAVVETYRMNPEIKDVTVGISLRNIKTGTCVANLF